MVVVVWWWQWRPITCSTCSRVLGSSSCCCWRESWIGTFDATGFTASSTCACTSIRPRYAVAVAPLAASGAGPSLISFETSSCGGCGRGP